MEKTLVILAAGMGSRFGGVKQIEPVGPNGEIISDYNIYNAIKHGFTKVVFIIRKHHLDIFKNDVVKKYEDKIKVEFAFQEFDTVPSEIKIPETREKVLGTAHAVLCSKDVVSSPFILINADDFYGEDAFKKASNFIDTNLNENDYLNVTYPVTLVASEMYTVKRGISFTKNNMIQSLKESEIKYEDGKYIGTDLETGEVYEVGSDKNASMNFFVFKPSVYNYLNEYYQDFLTRITDTNESLLPACIANNITAGNVNLYEEVSLDKWLGITYKEDLEDFKNEINKLIEEGKYPSNLWG